MSELKSFIVHYNGKFIRAYEQSEADKYIAELKDKIQMHDFFWEGCGFAGRGFKNTIAVSEAFENLEAQNESLLFALNESVAKQGFRNLNIPESLARLIGELADAKGENRRQQHKLRHSNHKRCLAMAEWCKLWYEEEKCEWSLKDVHHWFRMSLFDKWHKKWLALAEKFKEEK